MYVGEAHRCVDRVELREKLRLDYDITDDEYRSEHSVSGELRAVVTPDKQVVRAREYPPTNPLETAVQLVGDDHDVVGDGYPGTELIVALTRVPPTVTRDEQYQEGFAEQIFTVDGIPKNGTVTLDEDWSAKAAKHSLAEDEQKTVSREYGVEGFPPEQLPVVVRANLHTDAREYVEAHDVPFRGDPKQVEGQATLSIEVEYREDSPEIEGGTNGRLRVENFRAEMDSTFPNVEFLPRENSTYNPNQKRVEWREREVGPGEVLRYDVIGRMNQLLGMGRISATVRGKIVRDTLTGTEVVGVYDRTGGDLDDPSLPDVERQYGVTVTGDIEIDPEAVRSETRKVANATVSVNDTPFDAYDRVKAICDREGMTIVESQPPSDPEPVPGQEGVFQVTAGENRDADDTPGELEVKREYGDRGVVYANVVVTGQFTSMSQDREVSQYSGQSDKTEDRLVRTDEGGLETRGKSTVDVKARSTAAKLNAELLDTIESALGGGRV